MTDIPVGFCQCGCGGKTKIAPRNRINLGWVKGAPINFIRGHNLKGLGENHPFYRLSAKHRRRSTEINGKYQFLYRSMVENIIGYPLPDGAIVHHHDNNEHNNEPNNLVVCENSAYHNLIHRRQKALESCGHANWRKCGHCQKYDDPKNMYVLPNGKTARHRDCMRKHDKEIRARLKNER